MKAAQNIEKKKGGPYPKNEQEQRRDEVHKLHFEKGYSALKIAGILLVNRNTINDDIKFLYSEIKDELKQTAEDYITRQLGRMETQRCRLVERITENTKDSAKYEKMLLESDYRISNILTKIGTPKEHFEIKEKTIRDIVLFLITKHLPNHTLDEEEIIAEIINLEQTTSEQASEIFAHLVKMGLNCCTDNSDHTSYNMLEFAFLCRYVSPEDSFIAQICKLDESAKEINEFVEKSAKEIEKEYGPNKKWTDEMLDELFEKETTFKKEVQERQKVTIQKTLKDIIGLEKAAKYCKYTNTYFATGNKEIFYRNLPASV